ncbi:hypothetical protein ACIBW9_41955 [Streptomyces sp. NPDC049541]|uniref:hypothetical protein n=1 Tax=Streptomyces sp. NPDC049541 TaxID=3365594 RepID=UPI003793B6D1
MRPRETLTESQNERLLQVRLACQDITRPATSPAAFADLVRHQRGAARETVGDSSPIVTEENDP